MTGCEFTKRSSSNPAAVQAAVFAAFQKAGWPRRLKVTLPPGKARNPKQRHRQTIHGLNEGLERGTIRFHSDRRGGIAWRKDE